MPSGLPALARELGADERTLRRAAARGTVRIRRPGPRTAELDSGEREYLRAHWSLLSALVAALRTERNVRLAVLFGSVARGDEDADSDIDLLVDLRDESLSRMSALRRRLQAVTGQEVHLVVLRAAADTPLLMADVVDDGRVLVDRDGVWPGYRSQSAGLRADAIAEQDEAEARAREVFAYYARAMR